MKPVEEWTAVDWFAESARLQGDNDPEPDRDDDTNLCGAMLLASLQTGSKLHSIAAALEVDPARLEPFHKNCVDNGVFTSDGKIVANWFDEEHGGTSFQLDVLVALGLAGRAA